MPIPVVYEDEYFVIAEKPAGLLTVNAPVKRNATLTAMLGLQPCHRLDRDTSGLIILAKSDSARRSMEDLFRQRLVTKTYTAFVQGILSKDRGAITFPLEGKPARTEYSVSARYRDFTVVQVHPLTGRTNQIRLHFKAIGHPLVGEKRFVFRKDFALRANRLCLHARSLEFNHPITGKTVSVESGLPAGMANFLKKHAE